MCYNVASTLETQLKRARKKGDQEQVNEIIEKLKQLGERPTLFQASGFSHPKMLVYTNSRPFTPTISQWGLVPEWTKDEDHKLKIWNSTLNARGESIFEKPSFKDSAKMKRCIIPLDGFFEHHHYGSIKYPFFITRKDNAPLVVAGLYSEWEDPVNFERLHTFSIVTTKGNELLSKLHNNPKMKEARMPLILEEDEQEKWLSSEKSNSFLNEINAMIQPNNEIHLTAKPVRKLSGKGSLGNVKEAQDLFEYPELALLIDF